MQQALDFSRALRDDGAARALISAGSEWHVQAVRIAVQFFEQAGHAGALFEDVRDYATQQGLASPPSPNAWGAVCLAMSKRRLIVKTGEFRASRASKSHARAQPVWRLETREVRA